MGETARVWDDGGPQSSPEDLRGRHGVEFRRDRRHTPRLEGPHAIPAFVDPAGTVVWQGAFDSEATRQALEAWGVASIPPELHAVTPA
jgi:hypothetical protein